MFAFGCLFDIVRFVLLGLGFLCATLSLATWWLGSEHSAAWTVVLSQADVLAVTLFGPSPDLHLIVRRQMANGSASRLLLDVTVESSVLALSTIALCLLAAVMDLHERIMRRQM